jgi:Zn-dependent M28 family amino/carboxypeptidase
MQLLGSLLRAALAASLVSSTPSCDSPGSAGSDFDAERAWKDLERCVAFGARPAGSPALEEQRKWLEAELKAAGLTPVREPFRPATPVGSIEMANVYADLAAADPKAEMVILASHFDTKLAKGRFEKPFVGANDGGSSTAVLLELARALAKAGPRELSYRFLFLDGEEAVRWDWAGDDNTYGSRAHAQALTKSGAGQKVRALILLDMIGDKDLKIFRDTNSDRRLQTIFFESARAQGLGKNIDGKEEEISDDHLRFREIGIPSLDLIDLDYGPGNAYWHTPEDTLEHCAKDSLAAAGRIVLGGLSALERDFRRPR